MKGWMRESGFSWPPHLALLSRANEHTEGSMEQLAKSQELASDLPTQGALWQY